MAKTPWTDYREMADANAAAVIDAILYTDKTVQALYAADSITEKEYNSWFQQGEDNG
mgnify:CR=1 FL=1